MMISVVMSVFNEKEQFLRSAIESILHQTYSDFEFIIILDNPDNGLLRAVISEYAENDSRILFLQNETNMGLAMSLNRGISLAKGEFIARMDADDISVSNRFERQLAYLDEHPEIDILSTNKITIDENGEITSKGGTLPTQYNKIKQCLLVSNFIVHPSVIMKKSSVTNLGLYRNFPTTQDFDLWLRALAVGLVIGVLDEYLIYYRINTGSITFGRGALRQPLIGSYIRKLYKERKKFGRDSYSLESLNAYLDDNGANDVVQNEKYKKYAMLWEQSRQCLKNRKVLKGSLLFVKAFCGDKYVRKHISKAIAYNFLK